jgi:cardiolipin synthase A/B
VALVSCAATGCQSLPSATAPAPQTVRLQGARGPLSAAQSKQVLDALRSRQPATDILGRHVAIEEAINDAPLTTGNAAQLLLDGPATYAAMLAAMAGARDHINMETYIFDDDDVGQRFATVMLDKQAQGVQVNLMHDSVGTLGTPQVFFERLRSAGVQVVEFNPVNPLDAWQDSKDWSPNQRDHRKLLIVDGHIAFMGGINISSVYSGGSRARLRSREHAAPAAPAAAADGQAPPWRDTDLQLQGPVVAELQKLFIASWVQQTGAMPPRRNYFPPPQVRPAPGAHRAWKTTAPSTAPCSQPLAAPRTALPSPTPTSRPIPNSWRPCQTPPRVVWMCN